MWTTERWMECKMPRNEVELGTCIAPPQSTPTCCPLSRLPLCFLSRSFFIQFLHRTAPLIAASCGHAHSFSFTHTHTFTQKQIQHMHNTQNLRHPETHSFPAAQRQLCQLSFDLGRKVASTTNNDRHSRQKQNAIIARKLDTHMQERKCKTLKSV